MKRGRSTCVVETRSDIVWEDKVQRGHLGCAFLHLGFDKHAELAILALLRTLYFHISAV